MSSLRVVVKHCYPWFFVTFCVNQQLFSRDLLSNRDQLCVAQLHLFVCRIASCLVVLVLSLRVLLSQADVFLHGFAVLWHVLRSVLFRSAFAFASFALAEMVVAVVVLFLPL